MVRSIPLHDVLGDMNAKVGRETDVFSGAIRRESLHENCNENGFRLASFAAEHSLVIGGTLFKHRRIQLQTWISPDGNTRNQIDHVLVSKKHRRSLCDVKVMRGAECGSDHLLVRAKLKIKLKSNRNTESNQHKSIELANIANTESKKEIQQHSWRLK